MKTSEAVEKGKSEFEIWTDYKSHSITKHKIARNAIDYLLHLLRENLISESASANAEGFAKNADKVWADSSRAVANLHLYKVDEKLCAESDRIAALEKEVKTLKAENEWRVIATDGFPNDGFYLVSSILNDKKVSGEMHFRARNNEEKENSIAVWNRLQVYAWRPLPAPFGDENDEKEKRK